MTSFQDAPDEAIEADEAKEACSSSTHVESHARDFEVSYLPDIA